MKNISVQVELTELQYKRLLRVAALDMNEIKSVVLKGMETEEELIHWILETAVSGEISSGESYWGKYEEDYMGYVKGGCG